MIDKKYLIEKIEDDPSIYYYKTYKKNEADHYVLGYSRFCSSIYPKFKGKKLIKVTEDNGDVSIIHKGKQLKMDYCDLYALSLLLDQMIKDKDVLVLKKVK